MQLCREALLTPARGTICRTWRNSAAQPDTDNVAIYKRLLANLKLDAGLAERTAALVASAAPVAAPADPPVQDAPRPAASGSVPVRLIQVDDLLSIPGYTLEAVEKLREFVIVLPERDRGEREYRAGRSVVGGD